MSTQIYVHICSQQDYSQWPKIRSKNMFINKRSTRTVYTNQNYSTYEDSGKCNPFSKGKTFKIRQNDPNIRITKDLKAAMTITMK